uniref:Ribonuclease E n=1 Tax=Ochrobactrum sp. TCC-2 TaxID=1841544 RepID=A0A160E7J4_9HYPH|nr:ribonuclease E [Ochrobactrum sp. TCC-2]
MHDGEGLGRKVGKLSQHLARGVGILQVAPEWAGLVVEQHLTESPDDVRRRRRLHVAVLVKQVGAEQRPAGLLEQQACVPAVRDVGGAQELERESSCLQTLPVCHRTRRSQRDDIVDADLLAHQAAGGDGVRSDGLPFPQGPALVGLEVAEADPSDAGRVQDGGDSVLDHGELDGCGYRGAAGRGARGWSRLTAAACAPPRDVPPHRRRPTPARGPLGPCPR